MIKVGKKIVKYRITILIIGILLLIPSVLGYLKTRVNYDILYYLPGNIDTMKGQDILIDEFQKGAFAMEIVDGMTTKEAVDVKQKIEQVDGDATLMAIFFDDTTSADSTMDAIEEIRSVTNEQCYLSGMSAVVTDIKNLSEKEMPIYVLIAVVLSCIVLSIFTDCWVLPRLVSVWRLFIIWEAITSSDRFLILQRR